MVVPAILAGVLGALACLVLLYYFGGRRGRALYGLDSPRQDSH
jgi:membrane protein DedA with SNARE-associated domain